MKSLPPRKMLRRELAGFSAEDIAAGLQECVQDVVCGFVGYWNRSSGAENLCLAGGLFANVRLNQVAAQACGCRDLFVFPHMGDGGLCVGAAMAVGDHETAERFSAFAGPRPQSLPERLFETKDLLVRPLDGSAAEDIARKLASGKAVGIASGAMEFGPRALGNRSILFSAQDKELADKIGRALARPDIMPFAPVIRDKDLGEVTDAPSWTAFDYMTATATARPSISNRFPVAVHADGTMRIQIAHKNSTPLLYDILTAYDAHAKPALLINTSFNMHTEPIVHSSMRAFELFRRLPLAALVAADIYLVKNA